MSPKPARIRRTNSVKGGPRSQGGGTRNNGWNCLVMSAVLALIVLGPVVGVCAFWLGVAAR